MEDNDDDETTSTTRTRRVINSLVSGTFRIGKSEDLKIIQNLIVKTGSSLARSSVVSSDVWFYFGPLYGEFKFQFTCVSFTQLYFANYI